MSEQPRSSPISKKQTRQNRKKEKRPNMTAPSTPETLQVHDGNNNLKYLDHGLLSLPKNPKTGLTVPYDLALARIKNGDYGHEIRDAFQNGGCDESTKRILFLAGRDYASRDCPIAQLVEASGPAGKRFDNILSKKQDRDLLNQTIGAEDDQENYSNTGDASDKTYRTLYGEQVVTAMRYLQQKGAFGFVDEREMKKLLFFFRFQLSGTCYLTAVCIMASYLGQMAFKLEQAVFPPHVGKLIRSFSDDALFGHIVHDVGGSAKTVLEDILQSVAPRRCSIQCDVVGAIDDSYNLEGRLNTFGPGLVTEFTCTDEFQKAYTQNPSWQNHSGRQKKTGVDTSFGMIRFDMQDGQDFESVKGEFIPLRAERGSDVQPEEEIERVLDFVEEKTREKASWYECEPNRKKKDTLVGSPKYGGGGGDRAAHVYSPHSSPESVTASRLEETSALLDGALDDSRDAIGNNSIDHLSRTEIRDRPPAADNNEMDATHAMVCIGGRIDKTGKKFLLLQNSWTRMPLVEVSLNYFIASEACLIFVTKRGREGLKRLVEKDCFHEPNKSLVADCSNASY